MEGILEINYEIRTNVKIEGKLLDLPFPCNNIDKWHYLWCCEIFAPEIKNKTKERIKQLKWKD